MPIRVPVRVSGADPAACAMPKSVILTCPAGRASRFDRLDVPVDQARGVGGSERGGGLGDHVHGAGGVQRPARQDVGQRRAVHQLHHQERLAILAVVIYLGDPGMGQGARVARLSPEPVQRVGVLGVTGVQQLDRHRPAQHRVRAPPDLTRAAAAIRVSSRYRPARTRVGDSITRRLYRDNPPAAAALAIPAGVAGLAFGHPFRVVFGQPISAACPARIRARPRPRPDHPAGPAAGARSPRTAFLMSPAAW